MIRLGSTLLALTLLSGCASETSSKSSDVSSETSQAMVLLEQANIDLNKGLHKELIESLSTALPKEFPGTIYSDCFNGMDAIMVREFLGEGGGVVWANGVPLPSVFTSFMKMQHPPDGMPSIGIAVQDNVVVGTVTRKKKDE